MGISTVILTKNEEEGIRKCLDSVSFSDEIIIIDDNSIDKTRDIAKGLGAKVYKRKLDDDYSAQRNFGLSKAKNEWVLFIDADELVSQDLRNELLTINNKLSDYSGFYIKRRDVFLGKELKHGEAGNIKLLRFGRKDAGKFKRKVHEYWHIEGKVGKLRGDLIHNAHKDLRGFIAKISRYSRLHAKQNQIECKKSSIAKIILWPVGKFLYNYFYKVAILDGLSGFVISVLMSFHSFISWSTLWLNQKK